MREVLVLHFLTKCFEIIDKHLEPMEHLVDIRYAYEGIQEIIHKRTDIDEHFTREISPEYRICFIRKEKASDD
jgi:hypothetical protein